MTAYWCKWCGWRWQAYGVKHVRCIMCGLRLEVYERLFPVAQ